MSSKKKMLRMMREAACTMLLDEALESGRKLSSMSNYNGDQFKGSVIVIADPQKAKELNDYMKSAWFDEIKTISESDDES